MGGREKGQKAQRRNSGILATKSTQNTARQSRNRNGRGEPRNTRNTRKEGGESLSFLFRVFPVFSGSVRLWKILAACEQFGLLEYRGGDGGDRNHNDQSATTELADREKSRFDLLHHLLDE